MELTLQYRGRLLGGAGGGRVKEKQQVRLALSPQIGDFWGRDLRFNFHDLNALQIVNRVQGKFNVEEPITIRAGYHFQYPLGDFLFVPLVTRVLQADCALSIRLYRPQDAGSIIYTGGDLDNRLKTLFDALRMPHDTNEVGGSTPPGSSPEDRRVFCLLEDDELITKLSIESKRLLGPPRADDFQNYVELEIDVVISAVTPMAENSPFLFR